MQGKSFLSVLKGDFTSYKRKSIYSEYYNAMPWHENPSVSATMLRSETHKLVMAHSSQEGELYDLKQDPNETHNLYNDPAYTQVKLELTQELCDRMAETVDPIPPNLAAW